MPDPLKSSDKIPRILIADDDPSIVRVLSDGCLKMGFEVETASNGIQALVKANRCKPDIMIIDVNMPEIDGLSVCAHLLDPEKRPLNVVVVTGSRDPETIERCQGFGAYYTRKGSNFWGDLGNALAAIYPDMAGRIRQCCARATVSEIKRRPRVLLVDDDSEIDRFLTSRLEKCGIDVLYAPDGLRGFRMACRVEPAVIVTDYFMRNGDAPYLLSRLRTTAATENIPVIVLSGRNLDDVTVESLKSEIGGRPGATHVLRKSMDTHELFEALKKFCGFERDNIASIRSESAN